MIWTHCRFGLVEKPQPSPCWLRLAIHWTSDFQDDVSLSSSSSHNTSKKFRANGRKPLIQIWTRHDKTNQPIQAFHRAAVDRSTTYRFSFDKCFGLTNFTSNSDLFQDIFLDKDSYTINEPMRLSLVCICLTDVTYWQLTIVFKRWPRDKSQLQIHNRGLRQCLYWTQSCISLWAAKAGRGRQWLAGRPQSS